MSATKPGDSSLKHKVLKGSLWSFVAASGRQGFGLAVFIILSRLLSPTDFGTMAMAVAVVELLLLVVTLGLTSGIVRTPGLTDTDKNTAFWLNVAAGTLVAIGVFATSGLLAHAFGQPQLAPMLQVLAILPFLQSLTVVQEALLQRDMAFKNLAMRTLLATSGAGVLSVVLAFAGFGVYSLVFQRVSSLVIIVIALWSLSPWRPSLEFSVESAKRQTHAGISLLGSTFLNRASTRVVDIIVGAFLGAAAVGFYRVAGKLNDFLVQFLIDPLVSVSLSSFSKVQEDKAALGRMYRSLTQFCGLLTFPAFVGLAVLAPEITDVVFGPKWTASGQLMQILCFASLGATLNYFFKPLMAALGLQKQMLQVNLFQFLLILAAVTAASQFNIQIVMWAYVLVNLIVTWVNLLQVRKHVGVTLMSTVQVFAPPILSSALMAAILLAMRPLYAMGPALLLHPLVYLPLQIILGAVVYILSMHLLFRGYTRDIRKKILPLILSALKKRGAKKAS